MRSLRGCIPIRGCRSTLPAGRRGRALATSAGSSGASLFAKSTWREFSEWREGASAGGAKDNDMEGVRVSSESVAGVDQSGSGRNQTRAKLTLLPPFSPSSRSVQAPVKLLFSSLFEPKRSITKTWFFFVTARRPALESSLSKSYRRRAR